MFKVSSGATALPINSFVEAGVTAVALQCARSTFLIRFDFYLSR